MRARTLLVSVLLLAACLVPTEDHSIGTGPLGGGVGGVGGGLGATGGGTGGGGGAPTTFERCVQLLGYERLCTTVFPVVCGGVACAVGEVCCQTTGACVPSGTDACPKPPTNGWIQNAVACGSNADCKVDEFCMPDDFRLPGSNIGVQRCIGNSGHCHPLDNCGYCGSAPGSDICRVCGCDGRSYASPQTACVAGVTAFHRGACGVSTGVHDAGAYTIACGRNDQCPAGAQCCFRTGKCFADTEPWRCEVQPDGTILDCASHGECESGAGGGSGNEPPTRFCAAEGCSGPGLCGGRGSTSSCGGEVQQVCGCDGVTYVNACWARAGGTRVASNGACR